MKVEEFNHGVSRRKRGERGNFILLPLVCLLLLFTTCGNPLIKKIMGDGTTEEPVEMVDDTVITNAAIIITGPATGEQPSTGASGSGRYNIGQVSWAPVITGTFAGETIYTATLKLTANEGLTFSRNFSATINQRKATVANNDGTSLTVSCTFARTSDRVVTSIAVTKQPNLMTYTHGNALNLAGLEVTLTFDDDSMEVVPFLNFPAWNICTDPANGAGLSCEGNNGKTVSISLGSKTAMTAPLTVNKANGATVAAPTAETITANTVTLAEVAAPRNGQIVEYGFSTSITELPQNWQENRDFGNLSAGTTYFIFARSKENGNYNAGPASVGTAITTLAEES